MGSILMVICFRKSNTKVIASPGGKETSGLVLNYRVSFRTIGFQERLVRHTNQVGILTTPPVPQNYLGTAWEWEDSRSA